jgi:hypothetical protein
MGVTHKAKAGALLTGTEYEAADSHVVDIDPADIGAATDDHNHDVDYEAAGAVATHAAAGDPHTGYRLESADHSHATSGLQGGQVAHGALSGVGANDHHNQAHALNSADHTGSFDNVPVGTVNLYAGSGDPEGNQTAEAGSMYLRTNGSVYIKGSGSGDTGWLEIVTVG